MSEAKLSDLCEQIVDCPHSTPKWTDAGVIVLRNQYIKNGRLDLFAPSYTDEAHYQSRTRRAVPIAGDIVITREAPMGEVCMIPPKIKCCLGQRMVLLRPDPKKVDGRFLLYALQSSTVRHEILVNDGTGSTVSNLRIPLLEKLPILTPPLVEQRIIAHVLGTLDDKNELNRKMNETLEGMARALFKSWFVDFDPVRAKAEGRDTGLPAHIAALFPDAFVESPLGPVPRGWNTTTWGTVATLEYGKSLSGYNTETGIYPVYGTNGRIGTCSKPLCPYPGVVIGRKGAYRGVHYSPSPFFAIDTAFYVAPKIPIELRWAYYEILRNDINGMDSGSAIPSTSREDFYNLPVVVPPHQIQRQYIKLMEPIWRQQEQNQEASAVLRHLRDTLLPKLISGEIRVSRS